MRHEAFETMRSGSVGSRRATAGGWQSAGYRLVLGVMLLAVALVGLALFLAVAPLLVLLWVVGRLGRPRGGDGRLSTSRGDAEWPNHPMFGPVLESEWREVPPLRAQTPRNCAHRSDTIDDALDWRPGVRPS